MFFEQEHKSLQTELDTRTLVSEEEKVRLEGRVRELQTTFNSLNKELESTAKEKKSLLDELSSIYAGKMFFEEEYKSLQTELDTRTLVSEDEKVRLEGRVRELQTTFNSLNKELEFSRVIAEDKKGQLVDIQNRHSALVVDIVNRHSVSSH